MADLDPTHSALLADLERRIERLELSRRAEATSIADGAMRSADFDGEGVDVPGTEGWWLGSDGIVVNRAVIRTGSQIVVDQATQRGNESYDPNVTSANSPRTLVTGSVPVPDWATKATVITSLTCTAQSDQGDQFLTVYGTVEGTSAGGIGWIIGNTVMYPLSAQGFLELDPLADDTLNYAFVAETSGPAISVEVEAPTISVFVVFSDA